MCGRAVCRMLQLPKKILPGTTDNRGPPICQEAYGHGDSSQSSGWLLGLCGVLPCSVHAQNGRTVELPVEWFPLRKPLRIHSQRQGRK